MASNQVVVLDNGSSSIKAGFAGELKPSVIIPSYIGRQKNERCMVDASRQEIFTGDDATRLRGLLKLSRPIVNGVVEDVNELSTLWKDVFNRLKVNTNQHPLLITDCALAPRHNKEVLVKCAFETFGAPQVSVLSQTVLSLYASAKTSGAVVDAGEGGVRVASVIEGFALPHSVASEPSIGGAQVTELLRSLLRHNHGIPFASSAELEIVRDIKEKVCTVSPTPLKESLYEPRTDAPLATYTLPDGSSLKLGSERSKAPELIFNPAIWGYEAPSLPALLHKAIAQADLDLRRELALNILLAGGTTLCLGFVDRLLNDFKKLQPRDSPVRLYAPPDRASSAFLGGAVVAMLPSFKSLCITKSQFEAEGISAIHRLNHF